jgi:uncharacterized MnhB-related membrane protein
VTHSGLKWYNEQKGHIMHRNIWNSAIYGGVLLALALFAVSWALGPDVALAVGVLLGPFALGVVIYTLWPLGRWRTRR